MKRRLSLTAITILSLACLLTSCKDNPINPIISGEINGTVTTTGYDGVLKGVSQLKIYLLDAGTKPDTVNLENNKKLFIDSTFTDTNGNYKFQNLKEGKYAISPYIGSSNTMVSKDHKSPDPTDITISNQKQNFTINFSVTDLDSEGSDSIGDVALYDLKVTVKNSVSAYNYTMYIYRYEYYCVIPGLMSNYRMETGGGYMFKGEFSYKMTYGYTFLFYTMSNKFRFTFNRFGDETTYVFDYDLTLSSCPQSAAFEFDWNTHTFKRTN
jgi:hypothetical protein